jgi:hypothetical protein
MTFHRFLSAATAALCTLFFTAAAEAQAPVAETPWSADVSIGWDNSISGDFLTGGIGTLQGAPVAIQKQTWDDVYGTGLLFNATIGYALGEMSELRAGFTYQSTGSDDTLSMGTYRGGPLTASFDNYDAWGLDFGYRRYVAPSAARWRPYAAASLGFGRVGAIDVSVAQTAANFGATNVAFYDSNAAVTFGINGGALYRLTDRVSLDARLGLRYVSGLGEVENSAFSGLDDVNDGSSRWTLPLTVGAKVRF